MTFHSDHCIANCLLNHKPVTIHSITPPQIRPAQDLNTSPTREADIAEVSAYAFLGMAEKEENQVVAMWPKDFERLADSPGEDKEHKKFTTNLAAITAEDYEKFFRKLRKSPLSREQLRGRVPRAYHEWLDV